MDDMKKQRVMRLLEEAQSRVNHLEYMSLPKCFEARAMTIERKLVDLLEDIRCE